MLKHAKVMPDKALIVSISDIDTKLIQVSFVSISVLVFKLLRKIAEGDGVIRPPSGLMVKRSGCIYRRAQCSPRLLKLTNKQARHPVTMTLLIKSNPTID